MKGQKKRKKREEKYDKEEERVEKSGPEVEEEAKEEEEGEEVEENSSPKKKIRKEDTETVEELAGEFPSLPIIVPHDENDKNKPGVIFILERASLEVAKVGKVCFCGVNSSTICNFSWTWEF